MFGKLYLIATPIGNLGDITYRAVEILKKVDIIAAEDTRHSLKLLNYLDISKPMISYHRHNEDTKTETLINLLKDEKENDWCYCYDCDCIFSRMEYCSARQ